MTGVLARCALCAVLSFAALACDSTTTPTNTGVGTGSTGNSACTATLAGATTGTIATGTMTARIDGGLWTATCMAVALGSGNVTVGGIDSLTAPSAQVVAISTSSAVGIYQIGVMSALNAVITTPFAASMGLWQAGLSTGSGSLSLTSSSAHNIAGAFTFNLPASSAMSAIGTKIVTDGAFNLTF